MATCNEIVRRALIWAEADRSVPSGEDGQDAMMRLQDLIDGLPGLRTGHWTDVILSSDDDYDASDAERISTEDGYSPVINLPATYTNDCGDTVAQRDLSRVHVIGSLGGLYIWSQSNGEWRRANGLVSTSDSPFGDEDTAGLAAMLAVMLAEDAQTSGGLSPVVVSISQAQRNKFRSRFYRETAPRAVGVFY